MGAVSDFFQNIIAGHSVEWIVGQIFGIIAIILGFISFQVKTKSKLLIAQSATAAVFGIHYGLLGAFSGMAANGVNIVRNTVYEGCARRGLKVPLLPIIFVVIQCVICIFTWEAWYSVFILLGQGISTYCMSFANPQSVRKSLLITCPLVLIYDIFAVSVGGIIYESAVIISAIIGLWRNREKK